MVAAHGGHAVAALAVAAVLALCGCSIADADTDSIAEVTPTPAVTEVIDAPVSSGPTAVLTLATVEVDGSGVTVGGFVTATEESGGECVFTLTPAVGEAVHFETEGLANVESTSCGSPLIPMSSLGRGSWTVTLTYVAGDVTLESEPLPVEIP